MDDIITTGDIESELGHPLCYQYGFKKHVSPFEKNEWHIFENHVNGFTIKPAMIDRVYHLYSNVKEDVYEYEQNYGLFCRMWHDGVPYFVAMRAQCGNCGFDCDHCAEGDILFCKSAFFFSSTCFVVISMVMTIKRSLIKYIYLFYKMGIEFPNQTIYIISLLSLGEMYQC